MESVKNKRNIAFLFVLIILMSLISGMEFVISASGNDKSTDEWEKMVNETFDSIAQKGGVASEYIAEKNSITVNKVSNGAGKSLELSCTVNTIDAYGAIAPEYTRFLSAKPKNELGMVKSQLDFQLEFEDSILELLKNAEAKEVSVTIIAYETEEGWAVYTSDEAVNAVYGGIVDVANEVKAFTEYEVDGEKKLLESTNITKGLADCFALRYDSEAPDTSGKFTKWWNKMKSDFRKNFIEKDRWKTVFKGLWVTIKLTVFALIIGIVLGFLVAFVRCTYLKSAKPGIPLKILNSICQVYLTVIRGTPVVVQIMIIYFVIFMPIGVDKFIAAVICFGLNSGAYVAEIVRGGIMSVDAGQTETGRSLGFNYIQTMWYIVFPQAFKACLPALANEFVVLLKETSVAFYIGVGDLMYSGNAIRAATYSAFMPLVTVAIIYLIMVIGLSKLVSLLERRLRNSER